MGQGQIISPKAAVVQHKIQVNLGILHWNLAFQLVSFEKLERAVIRDGNCLHNLLKIEDELCTLLI